MLLEEKNKISEVFEFSILPYIQNRKLGGLGKVLLLQILKGVVTKIQKRQKSNRDKNLKVKICF